MEFDPMAVVLRVNETERWLPKQCVWRYERECAIAHHDGDLMQRFGSRSRNPSCSGAARLVRGSVQAWLRSGNLSGSRMTKRRVVAPDTNAFSCRLGSASDVALARPRRVRRRSRETNEKVRLLADLRKDFCSCVLGDIVCDSKDPIGT